MVGHVEHRNRSNARRAIEAHRAARMARVSREGGLVVPIILLESRITLKLDMREAWAVRNALGNMSTALWNAANVRPEDRAVMNDLLNVLDSHLHEPPK